MKKFTIIHGDSVIKEVSFDKERITVGRTYTNDIEIVDLAVSREHCVVENSDEGLFLRDLNSRNGTYLNGERIEKKLISDNDKISIGKHILVFHTDEDGIAPVEEEQDDIAEDIESNFDSIISEDSSEVKAFNDVDDVEQLVPEEDKSKSISPDVEKAEEEHEPIVEEKDTGFEFNEIKEETITEEKEKKDKVKINLGTKSPKLNIGGKKESKKLNIKTLDNKDLPKLKYISGRMGDKTMRGDSLVMGSGSDCDVVIKQLLISKKQAVIERRGEDTYILRHLGKRRKTLLNGEPVQEAELNNMDIIKIGNFEMQFVLPNA